MSDSISFPNNIFSIPNDTDSNMELFDYPDLESVVSVLYPAVDYTGRKICKYFPESEEGHPAGYYKGTITEYHMPFWHVEYIDGDFEDLTALEVEVYLLHEEDARGGSKFHGYYSEENVNITPYFEEDF